MTQRSCRARPAFSACFVFALLLPLLGGCGKGRGTVSGKVIYLNQPVTGGWLTFRPADPRENLVTVPIRPDGRYEARLPVGEVKIAIDNRE
jgi:hypothetical protein